MSPEQIEQELRTTPVEDECLAVDPRNEETVMLFLSLHTQWYRQWRDALHVNAWLGLRYSAVRGALRELGVSRTRRAVIFGGIQAMELAALPILNGDTDG